MLPKEEDSRFASDFDLDHSSCKYRPSIKASTNNLSGSGRNFQLTVMFHHQDRESPYQK